MTPRPDAPRPSVRGLATCLACLGALLAAACAHAVPAPPPPGIQPAAVSPQQHPRAQLTLLEVVDLFEAADQGESTTESESAAQPSDAARLEAMRSYQEGRLHALEGDLGEAERCFRRTTRLDPTSIAGWRELGELLLQAGNPTALSAFQNVLDRSPNDTRALIVISRHAMQRRDFDRAATLLTRLIRSNAAREDAALPYLIHARAGEVLATLGYDRAALEALQIAAALPDRFEETTRFTDELRLLYRARPDLWRLVGDAALRLDDPQRAADAYDQAVRFPTLNPIALVSRQTYVAMLLDMPDRAARSIAALLERNQGGVPAELLELIRYVAQQKPDDTTLRAAIDDVYQSLPPERRRLVAGSQARATAAAAHNEATEILRSHLLEAPQDTATLLALFDIIPGTSERVAVVRDLILAHPTEFTRFSQHLIAGADSARTVVDAIEDIAEADEATRLLLATALELSGDPRAAARRLADIKPTDPILQATTSAARSALLFRLGQLEQAQRLLAQDCFNTPTGLLIQAEAHEAMFNAGAARASAEAALDALQSEETLLVAEAHRRAGANARRLDQTSDAIRHYEAAAELAPWAEESLVGLFSIYSTSGDQPDEAQRIDVIRRAREAVPDGRVIQSFRIREAISRRQFDIAERLINGLLKTTPHDPESVATLRQIWIASGELESARSWLQERADRFPGVTVYPIELATVLLEEDRVAEARSLLAATLDTFPGSPDVSRSLEHVLRTRLGDDVAANGYAWKRIALLPQTTSVTIEMIELHARDEHYKEAIALLRGLADANFTETDRTRLANTLIEIGRPILSMGRSRISEPLVQFFLSATEACPDLPLATHTIGILLACKSGAPLEEIVHATDRLGRFSGEELDRPLGAAVSELVDAQRMPDAMVLSSIIADSHHDMSEAFLVRWLYLADSAGSREDVEEALATIESRTDLEGFFRRALINQKDYGLADQIQGFAARLSVPGHDERAIALYRIALEIDPDHAMCLNNLGYRFLERGERLGEAERLIARAFALDPEQASITDSLGWVRYKRGRLHDDEDGKIKGAITLLEASFQIALRSHRSRMSSPGEGPTLAVVGDHLGDALWAGDRHEEAVVKWEEALVYAQESIDWAQTELVKLDPRRDVATSEALTELLREMQSVHRSTRAKIEAADAGSEPEIAPIVGEGDGDGPVTPDGEPRNITPPPADAGIMVPSQSRHIRHMST